MMGQPYQGERLVVLLGWGWLGMMLGNNVFMPITTMVGAGSKSPPYASDGSFEPFNKGQPNGSGHSTKAHEGRPPGPSNPRRVRVSIGSMGDGGKLPRRSSNNDHTCNMMLDR
jgi:hypothetical protein